MHIRTEVSRAAMVDALGTAISVLGSQAALARLLGLSQPSVSAWVTRAKPLPPLHVLAVEAATGVSRHLLRPDVYPIEALHDVGIAGEASPVACERQAEMKRPAA